MDVALVEHVGREAVQQAADEGGPLRGDEASQGEEHRRRRQQERQPEQQVERRERPERERHRGGDDPEQGHHRVRRHVDADGVVQPVGQERVLVVQEGEGRPADRPGEPARVEAAADDDLRGRERLYRPVEQHGEQRVHAQRNHRRPPQVAPLQPEEGAEVPLVRRDLRSQPGEEREDTSHRPRRPQPVDARQQRLLEQVGDPLDERLRPPRAEHSRRLGGRCSTPSGALLVEARGRGGGATVRAQPLPGGPSGRALGAGIRAGRRALHSTGSPHRGVS